MVCSLSRIVSAGFTALVVCSPALADFITPDGVNYGWVRGSTANSAWAQWESFSTSNGPNAPDVGSYAGGPFADGAPAWNAFDTSGFGIVTGSGNLYAPGGALQAQVDVPGFGLGAGYTTTILLQVRTQGTEVNPATVNISGVEAVEVTELYRASLGGQGFVVDTLWRFELAGSAAGYAIVFGAFGPHMSLDRVSVDAFTQIPAPGALALLAIGGLSARRRRAL